MTPIATQEEIERLFNEMVASKRKVFTKPKAELHASMQILRDIQNGEIDLAVGIEFLIGKEIAYGHSREHAESHFKRILEGRMSDWPARDMGAR
jgi:hypothetical protein